MIILLKANMQKAPSICSEQNTPVSFRIFGSIHLPGNLPLRCLFRSALRQVLRCKPHHRALPISVTATAYVAQSTGYVQKPFSSLKGLQYLASF
jgi:hypothetical protein